MMSDENQPNLEDALESIGCSGIAELSAIFDLVPFGVSLADRSRGAIYANPAVFDIFQRDWPELKGYAWAGFVLPEDVERLRLAIEDFEHHLHPVSHTFRINVPGLAHPRWLNSQVKAVFGTDGSHVGSITVLRETTDDRERQAKVEQGQKLEAVGKLSARLAHDINNLLTAIIGNADLLAANLENSQSHAYLENIGAAYEQARYLTGQLLVLSSQHAVSSGVISLDEELARMEGLLRTVVGAKVEILMDLDSKGAAVPLTQTQLGQIVINLLTNAKDALGDSDGVVKIMTRVEDNRALLQVSDNGPGMSTQVLERASEPFFTTKEIGKGTGLGLATVKSLTDYAGGWVSLESEQGKGTTVGVVLPLLVPENIRTTVFKENPLPGSLGSLRVLVVEDDAAVRQSLVYSFALFGVDVAAAGTVAEARQLASQGMDWDVVVIDVMLPDGSGRELLEELRAKRQELPAVLCSGFSDQELQGVVDGEQTVFVEKPYRARQVLEAIRQVCKL